MSELNLIPNPLLVVGQSIILLSQIYIVKKLFVSPYLELQKKRKALTQGAEEEASLLLIKCSDLSQTIEFKIQNIYLEMKSHRQSTKKIALADQHLFVELSKKNSLESAKKARKELELNLKEEKQKIASFAGTIAKELFAKIILKPDISAAQK